MNVQVRVHVTPNIRNSSTRAHASEGENHTRNHSKNCKCKRAVRNVKQSKKGSNVAKHTWTQDHVIYFANAKVIDKGNHRNLKILESWHTALTDEADNNSNTLPAQYTILLRKELEKH